MHAVVQTLLVDRPATGRQLRIIGVACAALVALSVLLLPMAHRPLLRMPEFAGVFGAVVAVADLITCLLLAARADSDASPPIRVIACAYLFSALMALLHVLTFPGALLPDVPLIGSRDTVGLLFLAWRFGFAVLLLVGVSLDHKAADRDRSVAMLPALALTVGFVGVCLFLAVWVPEHLPDTTGGAFGLGPWIGAWSAAAVCLCALAVIWRTKRLRRTVYLWIGFVLLANALGLCLSETGGARYTVGWYAARAYSVLASAVLLGLLLREVLQLQRSLRTSATELAERAQDLQTEIHRRETAERRLAHAQKVELVGQLAGGVAHDFNNHLQIIAMRLELLRRLHGGRADAEEHMTVLARTVHRAKGLTEHLLSVSGRRAQQPQRVELQSWLPSCSGTLRSLLPAGAELRVNVAPDAGAVLLDPGELESALTNLVANARDALDRPDGCVAIAVRPGSSGQAGSDLVEIAVSDNGRGMTPDVMRRAFEPFFSTKATGVGYGLGLSQVQAFVERSEGMVVIDSTEGAGTTVRLRFPRLAASHDKPMLRSNAAVSSFELRALARGKSALVVDDNDDVAASAAALLEQVGMTVRRASSGDDALAALARTDWQPSLVLTDIVMPGALDGLALARQIRRHHPDVAVILCTGYSSLANEAALEGMPVLIKPYRFDELESSIVAAFAELERSDAVGD
jgi:signal transduction histidine kinase/CheY-like chemotaxis protein